MNARAVRLREEGACCITVPACENAADPYMAASVSSTFGSVGNSSCVASELGARAHVMNMQLPLTKFFVSSVATDRCGPHACSWPSQHHLGHRDDCDVVSLTLSAHLASPSRAIPGGWVGSAAPPPLPAQRSPPPPPTPEAQRAVLLKHLALQTRAACAWRVMGSSCSACVHCPW